MFIPVVALLALGLIVLLLRWGSQPKIHRRIPLADLRRFVTSLPAQMSDGSAFIADRQGGEGFLQLALRGFKEGVLTVEFGLPNVPWSATRFGSVVDHLRQAGFAPALDAGAGAVATFLRVTLSGPTSETSDRVMQLFSLVANSLGWGDAPTFDVRIQGSLDQHRVDAWTKAAYGAVPNQRL
jgi:hypothetical protein